MIRHVPMTSGIVLIALHDSYFINRLTCYDLSSQNIPGELTLTPGKMTFSSGKSSSSSGERVLGKTTTNQHSTTFSSHLMICDDQLLKTGIW